MEDLLVPGSVLCILWVVIHWTLSTYLWKVFCFQMRSTGNERLNHALSVLRLLRSHVAQQESRRYSEYAVPLLQQRPEKEHLGGSSTAESSGNHNQILQFICLILRKSSVTPACSFFFLERRQDSSTNCPKGLSAVFLSFYLLHVEAAAGKYRLPDSLTLPVMLSGAFQNSPLCCTRKLPRFSVKKAFKPNSAQSQAKLETFWCQTLFLTGNKNTKFISCFPFPSCPLKGQENYFGLK